MLGVTTIDDLLDLSKSDLQALSYKDDEGVSHHLPIGKINTILSIRSWFQTQESTEDAVFLTLTPALLTTHRRSQASIAPAAYMNPKLLSWFVNTLVHLLVPMQTMLRNFMLLLSR